VQHLQVSHRKSTLCRLLLEGKEPEGGDSGRTETKSARRGAPSEATDSGVETEDGSEEIDDDPTPKPA
jgi:hypothetical protein